MGYYRRGALAWGIFLLVAALGAAAGPKGYLKLLGPSPLRFRVRLPDTVHLELPPLVPRPAPATTPAILNTNQPGASDATGQSNDPALFPGTFFELAPEETGASSLPAMQTQPTAGAVLTPESVISYLVPSGTNAPARKLPNPSFVPPMPPPASGSSSATFESR